MADERLRIVVDEPYLVALGRCLFVFAGLEWNAVWCGEKLQSGFLRAAVKKTAGAIAGDLVTLSAVAPNSAVQNAIQTAAQEFQRLVRIRNDIMHAQPCSAPSGEQRLTRAATLWTISELENAADEFAQCSVALNDIFHHQLP